MTAIARQTTDVATVCTADEARDLTERIKAHAETLWALLLEAHERRAWKALGYETWNDYVAGEFAMSKQHSFRLLDQGRVIREIEEASGSPMGDSITERAARDLKPHLVEVTGQIRDRVKAGQDPRQAVVEVVETARQRDVREREERVARLRKEHGPVSLPQRDPARVQRERRVIDAIHDLAATDNVEDLVAGWPDHARYHLDDLEDAIDTLNRLRPAQENNR